MKNICAKLFASALLSISLMGAVGCGGEKQKDTPHEHTPVAGWKSDETSHWHTCSDCDEILDKANHVFTEWEVTKEATCGEVGSKEKVCKVCGYKITEEIPKTTEHTWTEWAQTKAPTCKEVGIEERTCTVCGEKETREIPKIAEHSWNEWTEVTAATCTEKGSEKRTCSICGEEETREIPALGHKFGSYEINPEPTLETEGALVLSCANCEHTETITLPKLDDVHYYLDESGDCMAGIRQVYTININEEFVAKFAGTMLEGDTENINAIANLEIVKTVKEASHREIDVTLWDTPSNVAEGRIKVSCNFCEESKFYQLPKLSYDDYDVVDKGAGRASFTIKQSWIGKQSFVKDFGTYCSTQTFIDQVLFAASFIGPRIELIVETMENPIWKETPMKLVIREKGTTGERGILLQKDLPSYQSQPTYYTLSELTGLSCTLAVWYAKLNETGVNALNLKNVLPNGQNILTILNYNPVAKIKPDTSEEIEPARLDHTLTIKSFDGGQSNGQGQCKFLCSVENKYYVVNFQYDEVFLELTTIGEYEFSVDAFMTLVKKQLPKFRDSELAQCRALIEERMNTVPQDFAPAA